MPWNQARSPRAHLPGPGHRTTAGGGPDRTDTCLCPAGAGPLLFPSLSPAACFAVGPPLPRAPVGFFTWPGPAPIPVPRVRAMRPFSLCWPVASVALTSAGQGRGHGPRLELLGARLPEGRSGKRFRSAAALSIAPHGPAGQAEGPSWRQSWMQSRRKLLETRPACCARGRGPLQHGVGRLEGRPRGATIVRGKDVLSKKWTFAGGLPLPEQCCLWARCPFRRNCSLDKTEMPPERL